MNVLVIAPHPDDEILGAGGTLLRRKSEGARVAWLIVTGISVEAGWAEEKVKSRDAEIAQVARRMGFDEVHNLRFPTAQLDRLQVSELVNAFSGTFRAFQPDEVLLPHPGDAHSDHRCVFDAATACTKWFRYPSVRRVLAYETPSETDLGISPTVFRPNYFVDIESFIEAKIDAFSIYASEGGEFPFPRSPEALKALAAVRGAASGFRAAEAFELLRERV